MLITCDRDRAIAKQISRCISTRNTPSQCAIDGYSISRHRASAARFASIPTSRCTPAPPPPNVLRRPTALAASAAAEEPEGKSPKLVGEQLNTGP